MTQPDPRVVALQAWNQANDIRIRLGTDLAAILAAADAVDPARLALASIRSDVKAARRANELNQYSTVDRDLAFIESRLSAILDAAGGAR